MKKGRIVIFSAGTGNPFFTTDTAATLRAIEIQADVILGGYARQRNIHGRPGKDPKAEKFDTITYDELYTRGLKIMDRDGVRTLPGKTRYLSSYSI